MNGPGRPREFDENEILDRGIEYFRTYGYESSAMDGLLQELGISRQSLYNVFGNKEEFFNRCIRRYREVWGLQIFAPVFTENAGLIHLKENIEYLIKFLTADMSKTCLLLRSTLEIGDASACVMREMGIHTEKLKKSISGILSRAVSCGEIKRKIDSEKSAAMIVSIIYGLIVMARTERNSRKLEDIASNIWHMLEN